MVPQTLKNYVFCYKCNKIYAGEDESATIAAHPQHDQQIGIEFPGIFVLSEFITPDEEQRLVAGMDSEPWAASQSGRRKQVSFCIGPTFQTCILSSSLGLQNYGPKTNFKKMKLALGTFKGFPEYSQFVQERFKEVPLLSDYQTIEQCSLEYNPSSGASIDPHIDDCWIWGERVVTVNCLSDSVLTLVR